MENKSQTEIMRDALFEYSKKVMDKGNMEIVKIKLNSPLAKLPEYKSGQESGADIRSIEKCIIPAGQIKAVPTGLSYEIPPNTEIQVRPRSGLAAKNGITVLNTPGTCDESYRGEICVIMINHSNVDFQIEVGDRIAQIVFADVKKAKFEIVDTLSETDRGTGGLGSTGIK